MRQPLSDAIDDYIISRRSKGRAEGTIKSNIQVLRRFLTITGNILVENVHEGHVDTYFRRISETRSARSQHNDVVSLKGFFKWAIRTRRAGRNGNPMADRESPKCAPRVWRGISVSKVPALLDSTTHPRDRILLALGVFTLGRSIEFEGLRIADLRLEDSEIIYRIPKTFKTDRIPITTELDEELRAWLTYYTKECGRPGMTRPLDPNWFLVPAKSKPRLNGNRQVIPGSERLNPTRKVSETHRIAQAALVAIGYPVRDENGKPLNEGMHTLRRSIARGLYEQLRDEGDPQPVETVRAMLNQATEKQTRDYIGLPAEREHRDARLKGKLMFPGLRADNVRKLESVRQAAGE